MNTDAFIEGQEAGFWGVPKSKNPHKKDSNDYLSWYAGWVLGKNQRPRKERISPKQKRYTEIYNQGLQVALNGGALSENPFDRKNQLDDYESWSSGFIEGLTNFVELVG